MLSAAVLIDAMQRRMQLVEPHLRRPAGEFPSAWHGWLASLHERVGAVTGATAQSERYEKLRRNLPADLWWVFGDTSKLTNAWPILLQEKN